SIGCAATIGTWSGGAGTFNPNNITLTAIYTPSAGEITAGTVTLTLTTDDPAGPCPAVNDSMTITIDKVTANTATFPRGQDVALKIKISDLLTNASDTDNETLSLQSFGATTASGSTVVLSGTTLQYTNSTPPNVADSFSYTVTDTRGCTASGTVSLPVVTLTGTNNLSILFLGTSDGHYTNQITLFGIPSYGYGLEYSLDLSAWSFL